MVIYPNFSMKYLIAILRGLSPVLMGLVVIVIGYRTPLLIVGILMFAIGFFILFDLYQLIEIKKDILSIKCRKGFVGFSWNRISIKKIKSIEIVNLKDSADRSITALQSRFTDSIAIGRHARYRKGRLLEIDEYLVIINSLSENKVKTDKIELLSFWSDKSVEKFVFYIKNKYPTIKIQNNIYYPM